MGKFLCFPLLKYTNLYLSLLSQSATTASFYSFVVEAKDCGCVLHLVSCRLCRLVPAAGSEQLRVGGSTEARDAVRHRERSGGEERSLRSVPHGGGVSPQSAPAPPEKRSADKLPR